MKQQFPVYFILEVLTGSKRFYSEMEKICYAIVMSARKLRHYFEAHTIKIFFQQNIIYRYGVPRHITVDNTKYFDNAMFREFCQQISTKVAFTSVYHPHSNGAVEKANSLIFQAMKKIL
jgi:IS30 family transposase